MDKQEFIKKTFVEIESMEVTVPQHPSELMEAVTNLQTYLNRLAAIQLEILSELVMPELTKQERAQFKYLREAVDLVASNLKMAKQQIALLVNNSELFDMPKAPKERPMDETDIPGQKVPTEEFDFNDEEDSP